MEDYDDLMKAVDVAIARAGGGVDTTRLAVLGGSYGGFMTNWVVGHTNRFAVAETDRSIFNWYSWYGSSAPRGRSAYKVSRPPPGSDPPHHARSPLPFP